MKYESAADVYGLQLNEVLYRLSNRENRTFDEYGKPKRYVNRNEEIDAIVINSSYDHNKGTVEMVHVLIYSNGDTLYVHEENYCPKYDVPEGRILARTETECDSCYIKEICHATSKFPIMVIKRQNITIFNVLKNMIDKIIEHTEVVELPI